MPEYRFGSRGQPVCTLRWLNFRLPFAAYDPESTKALGQDGQRVGAITGALPASATLIWRQTPAIFASQV